jgi:predicted ester cyclase
MDLKQLIINYVEQLNERNFGILDKLVSDEVFVGAEKITKEEYKQQIRDRINEYPDYKVEIINLEAKNGTVILKWRRTGTSISGQKLEEELMTEYYFKDGLIYKVS